MHKTVWQIKKIGRCLNRYWYAEPRWLDLSVYMSINGNYSVLWVDRDTGEIVAEDVDSSD